VNEEEESEYGLIMPFVVCQSNGGPYEDRPFVAGVRIGVLIQRMTNGEPEISSYEYPAMLPQIDLLAMHYGYQLESEPWEEHPDEWVYVRLAKTSTDIEDFPDN
jgi:hypothetical protein